MAKQTDIYFVIILKVLSIEFAFYVIADPIDGKYQQQFGNCYYRDYAQTRLARKAVIQASQLAIECLIPILQSE